jgi:hypothetical protein
MLTFKKKTYNQSFLGLFLLIFLIFLFNIGQAKALSPDIRQVKVPGDNTVYYLNHATYQRKAYLNEAIFLAYGNQWSDVKIISPEELARWSEARLIKTASSDDLYYIEQGKSIKMTGLQSILDYKLENVLPLTVSDFELAQYQAEASYQEAGLEKESGLSLSQIAVPSSPNANALVPGTHDNQVMTLVFQTGTEAASIQSLIFDLEGLYNDDLIDDVYLINTASGERVKGHSSFYDRQATISFNQVALSLAGNSRLELKVMLDLNSVENTHNQNIRFKVMSSESIKANLQVDGSFPLLGGEFKMVDAGQILGRATINEESLNNNGSQQKLGVFTITETSGQEDIYIKELVFDNAASAGRFDLDNFKLRLDNRLISSAGQMVNNRIVFDINYLRIPAGGSAALIVSANLGVDYQSGRGVNLNLERATMTGNNYGLSLNAEINNINESFLLP